MYCLGARKLFQKCDRRHDYSSIMRICEVLVMRLSIPAISTSRQCWCLYPVIKYASHTRCEHTLCSSLETPTVKGSWDMPTTDLMLSLKNVEEFRGIELAFCNIWVLLIRGSITFLSLFQSLRLTHFTIATIQTPWRGERKCVQYFWQKNGNAFLSKMNRHSINKRPYIRRGYFQEVLRKTDTPACGQLCVCQTPGLGSIK